MYSGEYDVCDVTLSAHPHRASWKVNCLETVGIEPATFGILVHAMLCQLSYAVKSVRVDDISELSVVPSISVYSRLDSVP